MTHCVFLGLLAGLGAANTQWIWEAHAIRGQTVTIQAAFLTETERIPEQKIHVASSEPAPLEPLQPTKITIQRSETAELRPIPIVEVGELPDQQLLELQQPERTQTVEIEAIVAATEAANRPREVALPQAVKNDTVAMPTVAGAAVDELPRQRATNRPPAYPVEAWRDNKQHGRVMIRALIADDGHVAKAQIETSSGTAILDDAALAAVLQWHFSPARRGNVAVEYEILIPVRFRL